MDPERALARLPAAYAEALRLRDAGVDHPGIAARLHIPVESVPPLLHIGDAKLARLLGAAAGGAGDGAGWPIER